MTAQAKGPIFLWLAIYAITYAFAREESIYIALLVSLTLPDGGLENVVHIFDPNGDVVLEHLKFGGV